ncbi:FAD-dependent oxidoreductase [Aquibium sp. LZ166]|uniref:FAD-dependent oxidoreductase n=1 Tax=Aquibium pacificus TaxID=3153579 RepID=A0ABV3SKH7_9HYPH
MGQPIEGAYDVVVAGSGAAGLSAALSAAKAGLKVVILEKSDKLGGGTSVSHGGIWVGKNHLASAAGYADSRDDILAYMRFVGGDQIREDNMVAYVDWSPRVLTILEDWGLKFSVLKGVSDHYFPIAPGSKEAGRTIEPALISANDLGELKDAVFLPPNEVVEVCSAESIAWGGMSNLAGWDGALIEERRKQRICGRGVALVTHFLKALKKEDVEIVRGAGVDRLVVTDGAVSGVVLSSGMVLHASKAVILATGGYESNPDLVAVHEGLPRWQSMFPESLTGDGMIMASELGAAVRTIHNNMALFLGFVVPPKTANDMPFYRMAGITELLFPHTLVVNRKGRRFADETYFQSMAPRLREYEPATHSFSNLPCYLVFDSQFQRRFSFAGNAPGAAIPDWVACADTIEELAAKLDVDAAGLAETVARYNGFAATGVDEDFKRGAQKWSLAKKDSWGAEGLPNPSVGAVSQGPFYGIELHPSAFCSAGLVTNPDAQVLNQRGHPISGLYAVGNASAHTDYGVGYQAGYSLASAMTFGYLAARHVAQTR